MVFENDSGYRKWNVGGDWDSDVMPANNDIVNHTANPIELIVDDDAYAGTLNVSHPAVASLLISRHGRLTVTGQVSLGASSGFGTILISSGGELIIDSDRSEALAMPNGLLVLNGGRLRWAGNHIEDLRALFASGAIEFAGGICEEELPQTAQSIGQLGSSELFAISESGYTQVFVVERASEPSSPVQVPFGWWTLAVLALLLGFCHRHNRFM